MSGCMLWAFFQNSELVCFLPPNLICFQLPRLMNKVAAEICTVSVLWCLSGCGMNGICAAKPCYPFSSTKRNSHIQRRLNWSYKIETWICWIKISCIFLLAEKSIDFVLFLCFRSVRHVHICPYYLLSCYPERSTSFSIMSLYAFRCLLAFS